MAGGEARACSQVLHDYQTSRQRSGVLTHRGYKLGRPSRENSKVYSGRRLKKKDTKNEGIRWENDEAYEI